MQQIVADLKVHLRKTTEKFLIRNIDIEEIPIEDLSVLCQYCSITFIAELFGGRDPIIRKKVNRYLREQKKKKAEEAKIFVSEDPSGIGGWKYAERLRAKALRELESVIHQGTSGTGQQLVNACKYLISETSKMQESAMGLMEAYEKQLIILAEFIVMKFLPALGRKVRQDLKDEREQIIKKIEAEDPDKIVIVFREEMKRFIRWWNYKKFELLFAELLSVDKETSKSFDFTKDMIETFIGEKYVTMESEETLLISRSIAQRNPK